MIHRFVFFPLILAATTCLADAQRIRCGTPGPDLAQVGFAPSDCGYLTNSPQPEYDPTFFYDIPVVFHVIQNSGGTGFLSLAKLQEQIDVLNEDFQAIPGSLGAPGTNGMIRFHLATVDPTGNSTTGVTYSTNNTWFQDNGNYWNSLAWDTTRYLNIYTNAVPCCYGYVSDFPSQGIAGQADDRVVLWWEAVGRTPTAGWPENRGRTATHEVGHYLGLYHTFDSGCGSTSNCYGTSDLICDTNRESNPTSGCPSSKSSCGSPDPIHNYMDYTDDPCMWEFTTEQVNRMRCTLVHWRPDLDTGVPDLADFCSPANVNSTGFPTLLTGAFGSGVGSDLHLDSSAGPPSQFGYILVGTGSTEPGMTVGAGRLCLDANGGNLIGRYNLDGGARNSIGQFDANGDFQNLVGTSTNGYGFDVPVILPLPGSNFINAGETWYFQLWHRDTSTGGSTSNFSNGFTVTF